MMITNTPQEVTVIEAEARKSLSFGVWLVDSRKAPCDLTDASMTFTIARVDKWGVVTALASDVAYIESPTLGYATVNLQADELNFKPSVYQFTLTLRIKGYSVVLMKGDFKLLQNTEFDSINSDYVVSNPGTNLEIELRQQMQVHIELSSVLPPNLVIPTDASDAAVAGYINDPGSQTRGQLDLRYATNATVIGIQEDVADLEIITADHETRLDALNANAVLKTAFDAKGDLLVGLGSDSFTRMGRGADNTLLTSLGSSGNGFQWNPIETLLPGRLKIDSLNVVDANLAFENGWYKVTDSGTPNIPVATGVGVIQVIRNGNRVRQFFWRINTESTGLYDHRNWMRDSLDGGATWVSPWRYCGERSGTTSQRDQAFGVPSTTAEIVDLANWGVTWWNTSKGWLEGYFAPSGTAGLTGRPLLSGRPAGWYPIAGKLPHVKIYVPAIGGIGANQYRFRTGYWTNPSADQIDGITVNNTDGTLTLPTVGTYEVGWCIAQSTGTQASLIIGCAWNTTTPTTAPAGTTFGVNGVFAATELPNSTTNYTFNTAPAGIKFSTLAATDHFTFWFNGGTGTTTIIGWAGIYPGMVQAQYLSVDYVSPPFVTR